MEIGAILKEARESKNISLESLQESTKIQKRYLKAIEQGNFHILPGTFYARAFIKEYAEAVGLNAEELLRAHQNELPTSQTKSEVQYTRMQRSRKDNQSNKSPVILSIIPKIIVILLIIGALFIAITLYKKSMENNNDSPIEDNDNEIIRNKDQNNDQPKDEPNESGNNNSDDNESDSDNGEENDEETEEQQESELLLIEEGSGSIPESTFELTNAGDEVILVLEPSGESWIDVVNDENDYLFRGMTEPNTPIEVDVSEEDRVMLSVGRAPDLPTIYINDIEFEYPFDPNQFVTQRFWFNIKDSNSAE